MQVKCKLVRLLYFSRTEIIYNMRYYRFLYVALAATGCTSAETEKMPNVIYILVDDLGIGDLSCYGQRHFTTPNIDRLASEGMIFSDHYSGSTVSAPSRASLMTGLHTGHLSVRGNREMKGAEGQHPMSEEEQTLANLFKDAGYSTAAFGKWGLGYVGSVGDPNNKGFDEFFGYNCQREAHRYYPTHLWHNDQKVILEGNDTKTKAIYAPDMIQERALEYIRQKSDEPFFLYLAIVPPHAELLSPEDEILEQFRGKFEETPYIATSAGADYGSEDFSSAGYCSQPEPRATFAAMVTRVDNYVGQVMDLLSELGIEDNTLVIFSSDNGTHREGGADPDFFGSNGGFRGYKRDMTDGGIRTPMIARWSGVIEAGSSSGHISAFWDMMPTFAELTHQELSLPTDGISMLPTLLGEQDQQQHEALYWEFTERGGDMAVRMGQWKALRLGINNNPDTKIELYDITKDKQELNNLADDYPDVVEKTRQIMDREHTPSENFPMVTDKK